MSHKMEIIEVTDKSGNVFRAKLYDGVPFRVFFPGNVSDHLEQLGKIEYFENDTMVLSYPKSGTHFVSEIVKMIRTGKAEYHDTACTLIDFKDDLDYIKSMVPPRVYASHLRPRHLPKSYLQNKRKITYVYRNPKDVAVSLYTFFGKLKKIDYNGTWDDFLDLMLHKNAVDSWFDYTRDVEKFIKENPDYPILVVSYENMKKDLLKEVKRIAEFLESGISDKLCEEIAKKCEFSSMNKAKNENVPKAVQQMSKGGDNVFYRKGIVGDWKNWFTVSMNETFDEIYKEKMKGVELDVQFTID